MSRYLARSAGILSDADRFETQVSWLLFVAEQEALLAVENDWSPGDPLYDRPKGWLHGDQHIRRMIQEIPIDDFHVEEPVSFFARCEDCMVYWTGPEPCWSCGIDCKPSLSLSGTVYNADLLDHQVPLYAFGDLRTYDNEALRELRGQFEERATSELSTTVRASYVEALTEMFGFSSEQILRMLGYTQNVEPYIPPPPQTTVFDVETLGLPVVSREIDWAEVTPTEIDANALSEYFDRNLQPANPPSPNRVTLEQWVQSTTRRMDHNPFNPPATERRRPRNI